MLFLSKHL